MRIIVVGAQCQAEKPNCFLSVGLRIGGIAPKDISHVTDTCDSCDKAKSRVQLQGSVSQPDRLGQPFARRQVRLRQGAEKKIICSEVLRSPPRRDCNFCLKQFWLNGRDNGDGYFVLKSEDVGQVTLEPVRPNVC